MDVTMLFSCSNMGTARVPEFTFTWKYCQEPYLIHKLRGVTSQKLIVPSLKGKNWLAIALYYGSALLVSSPLCQNCQLRREYLALCLQSCFFGLFLFVSLFFGFFFMHSTLSFHDLPASVLLANDTKWVKSDKSIILWNLQSSRS